MKFTLSVPSKTFLLGEYLALNAGASLILNTAPRFSLEARSGDGVCEGIHPQSPAGRWVRLQNHLFQTQDLKFIDPHHGQGGFGASSAQFALISFWQRISETPLQRWGQSLSVRELWRHFRESENTHKGEFLPSGADVVGQVTGGITHFTQNPFHLKKLDWSFSELGFFVLRTGVKVKTHEHLNEIKSLKTENLEKLVQEGLVGLHNQDKNLFCQAVNEYRIQLQDKGFLADTSAALLNEFKDVQGVKAYKACGAMGADTLLIVYDLAEKENIIAKIKTLGLEIISDEKGLASGFQMQMDYEEENVQRITSPLSLVNPEVFQ